VKSILVNIQIDNVKAVDLVDIEEVIEEALKKYTRKRVQYSLNDMYGPPIPVEEPEESE
jgi:hypothetical protein